MGSSMSASISLDWHSEEEHMAFALQAEHAEDCTI